MQVQINFDKKMIHFPEDTGFDELAQVMTIYFPTDIWGDFEFCIDGEEGIDDLPF